MQLDYDHGRHPCHDHDDHHGHDQGQQHQLEFEAQVEVQTVMQQTDSKIQPKTAISLCILKP